MLRSLLVMVMLAGCSAKPVPAQGDASGPPPNSDFDSVYVPPSTCNNGWRLTYVPRRGSDPRYAVAPDGSLHLLYIGYGGDETALRHVAEGTPESAETVGMLGLGSLAIGPDGNANAFLAAHSGVAQKPDHVGIVEVTQGKQGWSLDDLVSTDGGFVNASAIDAGGHAHLAFSDDNLFYATNVGGSWVTTQVGTQTQVAVFKLDVDGNGHVHIWFSAATSDGTTVASSSSNNSGTSNYWASNESGAWHVVPIPDDDIVTAVDSKGAPHIVSSDTNGLVHAWFDGTTWQSAAIPIGDADAFDMRLDGNDDLHLVVTTPKSTLAYVTNAGGSWQVTPIMSFATGGLVPDAHLGLDKNGDPHVAIKGPIEGAMFAFARRCQ